MFLARRGMCFVRQEPQQRWAPIVPGVISYEKLAVVSMGWKTSRGGRNTSGYLSRFLRKKLVRPSGPVVFSILSSFRVSRELLENKSSRKSCQKGWRDAEPITALPSRNEGTSSTEPREMG